MLMWHCQVLKDRLQAPMHKCHSNEPTQTGDSSDEPTWISNYSRFREKHLGVPGSPEGSNGTLYPLTRNYMLLVAQATGRIAYILLYLVVMFTHHQKDTCVTLFAGAAVMRMPLTQCVAMLNHSYYLSFNDFQN